MRAFPMLAVVLLAFVALSPLAAADPVSTPCVRKVLTVPVIVGCRGSDGRTDAVCYIVVSALLTTEMVCVDTDADGELCVVAYYGVTWDPLHRSDGVPACVPNHA